MNYAADMDVARTICPEARAILNDLARPPRISEATIGAVADQLGWSFDKTNRYLSDVELEVLLHRPSP